MIAFVLFLSSWSVLIFRWKSFSTYSRSVEIFVASGGIPTQGQSVRHVGIFIGIGLAFRISEIGLGMRLGPYGQVVGLCGLV